MNPNFKLRIKDGQIIGANRVDGDGGINVHSWEDSGSKQTSKRRARELIRAMDCLPAMPSSLCAVSRVIDDPKSGAEAIEAAIRPDPALTANLLRMANSPYFKTRKQVGSVRQAVSLLGTRRVFDIAASAWLSRVIPSRLPGYGVGAKSFWLHCLAVGSLAEQLVEEAKIEVPELVFTAGVLHDIGKLAVSAVIMHRTEEILGEMENNARTWVEAEREILGTDHGEVGGCLLEEWGLPDAIAWGARWHHQSGRVPEGIDRNLIDVVHIADGLAHSLGFGADAGELARRLDTFAIERLMIGKEELDLAASEVVVCHVWEMADVVEGGVDV